MDNRERQYWESFEQRYLSTIKASPMGMHFYVLEEEGRLIFEGANPAADRILGVNNSRFIGMSIEEAFPLLKATDVPESYRRVAREGVPWRTEQVNYDNGIIIGAFEVIAYQTEPMRMTALFLDITERKRTENLLKESEERMKLALEGAELGTWDWMIPSSHVFFDERLTSMLGYRVDELPPEESTWERLVHPEDFPEVEKILREHLEGKSDFYQKEHRVRHKDGHWVWVLDRGKVISRESTGNPLRACGTLLDITAQKEISERLKHAKNYITDIFNSMPSVLIGVRPDGTLSQWNHAATDSLNLTDDRASHKNLAEILPYPQAETGKIIEALSSGKELKLLGILRQDGDRNIVEDVTVYPLMENEFEGAVIRIDDVTEKMRIQEMMIQSEKMLSIGGVAAGMAHEINNPLAGMIQNAEILARRLTDGEMEKNRSAAEETGITMERLRTYMEKRDVPRLLEAIRSAGKRAAEIVENMLSFARKDNSGFSGCSVSELMDKSIELASTDYDLKKQYDFRKIAIERHFEKDLPEIICQRAKIQQVFFNLLRNGAQAMYSVDIADPKFVITVRHDRNFKEIEIEIKDNGSGMEPEVQQHLFEPFFTTKPAGIGTGLGLSVSYFIIRETHKGSIAVQSAPGKGSTFTIRLPVERKDLSL